MSKCDIRLLHDDRVGFVVDTAFNEGFIIGRSDEAVSYMPDIDLSPYDSRNKGVSRRHAALVTYEGAPHLIDLFSANGTYLNGEKLAPDQPYPLAQVNEIRLGTLDVIITIS